MFPINNLREAVDAAKRVLTKEKLDKHLSGQTVNTTPFMMMGDTSHSGKKVSINAQDSIGEKIENLHINDVQNVYATGRRYETI